MAAKGRVAWTLIDNKEKTEEVVAILKKKSILYVDAEGTELGRDGKLCLLQIATDEDTYLFDVLSLAEKTFNSGLREILEDPSVLKVFFDCREDCNALKHQYNIHVKGIEDLQMMNAIRRKLTFQKWNFLSGLGKCMEVYLPGERFAYNGKDVVKRQMDSDRQLWSKRPMTDDLLRYAAADVYFLEVLREKMGSGLSLSNHQLMEKMLPYSSQRYAAFLRDNPYYSWTSPYIKNARIPEGIIPDSSGSSFIAFEDSGTRCLTCHQFTRSFRDQCGRCVQISGMSVSGGSRFIKLTSAKPFSRRFI